MNSNEYQKLAARTLIDGPEQPLTAEEICMAVTLLRMHSELGQLTEKFKKNVLHRHCNYSLQDFELDVTMLGQTLKSLSEFRGLKSSPKDFRLDDRNTMVLWNVIGLLGESSELAELLLACDLSGLHGTREEWRKELGDVAWYHAAIAIKLGLTLGNIQEANIDKLKKRFPQGFTTEDSVARVDVPEVSLKTMANTLGQVSQIDDKVTMEPMSKVEPLQPCDRLLTNDGAMGWN